MKDILGTRIKDRRIFLKMTQEELGKKVNVTKATINKYETHLIVNLKRPVIEKLAIALGTTPAYLMGWDSNTYTSTENLSPDSSIENINTVTINGIMRTLSKEEAELLKIYKSLDVKGRLSLLTTAIKLSENKGI